MASGPARGERLTGDLRISFVSLRHLAALSAAAVVAVLVPGLPAFAHGAPISPVSRQAACGAGGGLDTGSTACKAALAANGGAFPTFDDLRVPNVNGNDRKFVPDGKLCSGGLESFKGLDVARDDFPATTVTGGRTLAVQYRATLPHQGTFRVYITKQGYSPLKKLTWEDLGSDPIASVTNPPLTDGSYRFDVKLPTGRTGRQMLYIVWQTSSTADTYYSCSDLAFKPVAASTSRSAAATTKTATKAAAAKVKASATPSAHAPATTRAASPAAPAPVALTPASDDTQVTLGHGIIAGATVLALGALAWAGLGRLRGRRAGGR